MAGIFKQFALAATGIAATLGAVPANAEPMTIKVPYADLDLHTADGQQELDRRLDRAARKVCGFGAYRPNGPMEIGAARECYLDAKKVVAARLAQAVTIQLAAR